MKYTIELTDAEREVICSLIRVIRDNSLGDYRIFEDTELFEFNEESADYSAAYCKGKEDGNKIADKDLKEIQDSTYDVAYTKGVEDFENLFVHEHDYEQFFEDTYGSKDPDYNLYDLVAEYGAKKVLNDFKKWQEEKKKREEEIKVGDEVIDSDGDKGIITSVDYESVAVLFNDGSTGIFYDTTFKKTGRHFDEVEQLLNKLKGDEG